YRLIEPVAPAPGAAEAHMVAVMRHLDGHHFTFHDPARRVRLELHWRVSRSGLPRGHLAGFLARRGELPFCGVAAPICSPEDGLLYLCVHGVRHSWRRLGWLADVALYVRVHEETLDWDALWA